MLDRLVQSCYGVCLYLSKTFWPQDLVAYYPLPRRAAMMTWPCLGSVAFVLAITLGILALGRRRVGLAIAWIVYLVILAPNLGIVRISNQLAADRYCYVASMSLAAVMAYCLTLVLPWIEDRRYRVVALAVISSLLIAGLSVLSWRQCRTWQTIGGLWQHVHDHGYSNDVTVLFNMGLNRSLKGDDQGAMEYYARAIKSDPRNPDAHNLLGAALSGRAGSMRPCAKWPRRCGWSRRYAAAQNDLGSPAGTTGSVAAGDRPFQRGHPAETELSARTPQSGPGAPGPGTGQVRDHRAPGRRPAVSPIDAMLRNDLGLARRKRASCSRPSSSSPKLPGSVPHWSLPGSTWDWLWSKRETASRPFSSLPRPSGSSLPGRRITSFWRRPLPARVEQARPPSISMRHYGSIRTIGKLAQASISYEGNRGPTALESRGRRAGSRGPALSQLISGQ